MTTMSPRIVRCGVCGIESEQVTVDSNQLVRSHGLGHPPGSPGPIQPPPGDSSVPAVRILRN